MKKVFLRILVLMICVVQVTCTLPISAAAPVIKFCINGSEIKSLQEKSMLQGGKLLVPAKAFTTLLCSVNWLQEEKTVSIKPQGKQLEVKAKIGQDTIMVNGKSQKVDTKTVAVQGKVYMSAQTISAIGLKYVYNPKSHILNVSFTPPKENPAPKPIPVQHINPVINGVEKIQLDESGRPVIDNEKVIKELSKYKDNQGACAYDLSLYISNSDYINKFGEAEAKSMIGIAKGCMDVTHNVNYKTMPADYRTKYLYYRMPGSGIDKEYELNKWTTDIKKYSIVMESIFISDTSLVYLSKDLEDRVRGRFYFRYQAPTNKAYFVDNKLPNFEIDKWYYVDMEINLGDFFSSDPHKWEHSQFTYKKTDYLSNYRALEGV